MKFKITIEVTTKEDFVGIVEATEHGWQFIHGANNNRGNPYTDARVIKVEEKDED